MQQVSLAWLENQEKQIASEGLVELSYRISDPDLPDTEASDNGALSPLSQTPEIMRDIDRYVAPYATLETDFWLLDGSKVICPDDGEVGYSGYISNLLCDNQGIYSHNPIVRIDFDALVTSTLPGLTITWSSSLGEYPTAFTITPYNGNSAHTPKLVTDNRDIVSVINFDLKDFDRIDIEINQWCRPYRRARIERIFLGIHKTYDKSNLLKFSCSVKTDPLSSSLPKYEIQFELDNRDGLFNPTNPEGLTKYMMERQEVRARFGYKLGQNTPVWIDGGVYYLSEWNAPQNGLSASFKARDLLGFMSASYYKGVYEPDGVSLYDLAERVLLDANLPTDTDGQNLWVLDDVLKTMDTQAPLPVCSMAKCLQLITNAACCSIFFDRRGRLHMEPFGRSNDEIDIGDDHSYSKAEINLSAPIRQFEISRYNYIAESSTSKQLYNGTLTLDRGRNEFLLEYSDLAKNAVASLTMSGGVTVISRECYAKSCKLVLQSDSDGATCDVTVMGIVIKPSETAIVIPHLATGETQTLKNQLITRDTHAQRVGAWLKSNLTRRKSFSFDWRVDPRVEPGDIANVQNGGIRNRMRLTSSSFSFNGAFRGKSEGVEMQ